MSRPTLISLAAVVAALVAPTAAHASTATVFQTSPTTSPIVRFNAASGQENDLDVRNEPGTPRLIFTDPGDFVIAHQGCQQLAGGSAVCDPGNVEARLRNLDDQAFVVVSLRADVWGGSGADHIVADSFGQTTRIYGESGDDYVSAGGEGGQVADGGTGNDEVVCCGFAGGGTALGGPGADLVRFDTGRQAIANLQGGTGDDVIVARQAGLASTADGGDGSDIVVVHGTMPTAGTSGEYTINGGLGNDTLIGGPDDDTIDAGAGRDYVDSSGGGADTVSCGAGFDVARYDAADAVAGDCETQILVP
jgi:Ca2+-binding RTX toxin-like protein